MLGTWERFDSPNNLLMDWLFPTSWYHRCLSYCPGKTFQSSGFLLQRGTCAHSLSHKGYNSHKSNHRFPCYVFLVQCPHLTLLLCRYLPTTVQLDLTIILNTLHSAHQISPSGLITYEAGRDGSIPSFMRRMAKARIFFSLET